MHLIMHCTISWIIVTTVNSLQRVSIHCYTMHLKFSYNYLPQDIMYYNAHYE